MSCYDPLDRFWNRVFGEGRLREIHTEGGVVDGFDVDGGGKGMLGGVTGEDGDGEIGSEKGVEDGGAKVAGALWRLVLG